MREVETPFFPLRTITCDSIYIDEYINIIFKDDKNGFSFMGEIMNSLELDMNIIFRGGIHSYREERRLRSKGDLDVPGIVSFGFFLIIIGIVYLTTPNIIEAFRNFFRDIELVNVPGTPNIFIPAPASSHPLLYGAFEKFCYAFGAAQVIILILRLIFRSNVSDGAKNIGDIVFWLGLGYVAGLLKAGAMSWFSFWSSFIIFAGLSLIIKSLIILIVRKNSLER